MHRNADIDALASAYYLSKVFGQAHIASDGLDRFARNIARKFSIDVRDDFSEDAYEEIIAVDTASREQLGKFKEVRIDRVYDHHASNDIIAEVRVVKPDYPSCSEMLYEMFGKIEDRIAAMLLIGGIITDTRWFRHANTRTFEIMMRILSDSSLSYEEASHLYLFPYVQSERVAILKGMQRLKFRSKGNRIIASTIIGAHESSFATLLAEVVDVVFVASSKGEDVRITGRSRELNLLEVYERIADGFPCTYGGHINAAGMRCRGDAEAILNALMMEAERML